ncbi:MAG: M48 family metalloprotease [Gammaproteobacteria bacterium]|nr:M48 family metalloprotease [Gammaproteobacteria bacterium]
MKIAALLTLFLLTLLLGACATNPVTGKSELALVPESSELDIGSNQYLPSRQLQGGDYTADPELTRYVSQVGAELAKVSDRKLPYEFAIVNDSSPNAWALPGGKIAINRGLLVELNSEAELAAVLGHEIVHAAARHSAQGIERGVLLQGALTAVGLAAGESGYADIAMGAASLGGNLINQRYSREAELESDQFGMLYMQRAGYDPSAAIGLQETFVRLFGSKEPNWLSGLFASHPPSPERVEKNRQTAARLGRGGKLGREIYRRMIAHLRQTKPAYDAYDEGVKLLDRQPGQALRLADKAISIEPREALFHALRGDAYQQQNNLQQARRAYDKAISLNPEFFLPYLQRGVVRSALGDDSGARSDLQRSLQLLPTADAHYHLGRLAQENGDRRTAVTHYQVAARSQSKAGKAASRELATMQLSTTPGAHLDTRLGMDRSGNLLIQISNNTGIGVRNPVVLVGRRDAAGNIYRGREHKVEGVLMPGRSILFNSGIRGLSNRAQLSEYDARVVRVDTVE